MRMLEWHSLRAASRFASTRLFHTSPHAAAASRFASTRLFHTSPHARAQCQVFHEVGVTRETDIPSPTDPGEDVVVKVDLATICGSDLHTMSGSRKEPTPLILGHEGVGKVVYVPPSRKDICVGDRITWSVADSCGHCRPCSEFNLPEKCDNLFKYGHACISDGTGLNGTYSSEIVIRPGTTVVKVPPTLSDKVVAPANCALATMVNALEGLSPRSAVIQGAGLLGIYAIALLKERGVDEVFCTDINPNRLAIAEQFGAITFQAEQGDACPDSVRSYRPSGVDLVVEVAGVPQILKQGMSMLRYGGHYSLVGLVHPNSSLPFTGEDIIRKCATIKGSHNYSGKHLEYGVQFLDQTRDKYPYEDLVSDPFPLSQLNQAVMAAQAQAEGGHVDKHFARISVAC